MEPDKDNIDRLRALAAVLRIMRRDEDIEKYELSTAEIYVIIDGVRSMVDRLPMELVR